MADLLIIVPTKGRPHLIHRFCEAVWSTTAEATDIVLVVCADQVTEYFEVTSTLQPPDWASSIGTMVVPADFNYPSKLNAAAADLASEYRFLAFLNDDHVAVTAGWDTAMKAALADDPFGVAYCPDGVWEDGQVPAGPMVTASMQAALGWVALPGLHHILVDNVWMDLAKDCGTLHWMPKLRIQHHHYTNGLAPEDATYRETSNGDRANQDGDRYSAWLESDEKRANVAALKALWT